jgi:hypothetical protein
MSPVSGVTTGDTIAESWGDDVAAAISALEAQLHTFAEGTFTPSMEFATPGTSSWTVTTATGWYGRQGKRVSFHGFYQATLAKGTGSGNVRIAGLPLASSSAAASGARFLVLLQGWTKAGYGAIAGAVTAGGTNAILRAHGSGVAIYTLTAADMADGTVIAEFSGQYLLP